MNRFKELRIERGLTLQELADATHTTKSALSLIENGKRSLSIQSLKLYAEFFGVSTDYLLGGDDERTPIKEELKDKITQLTTNECKITSCFITFLLAQRSKYNEK